jgi:bla regulator protein BlaR1
MNAGLLVSSIGWTLIHFIWQGALIGCVASLALIAMRNARPEHRYSVACAALLLCVTWPALDLYLRVAGLEVTSTSVDVAGNALTGATGRGDGVLAYLQGQLDWVVAGWALCAGALGLRMALGLLWIDRAARSTGSDAHWQARLTRLAAGFGVTREVRLRVVEHLASPVTAGLWRPVVLVPASLLSGMPAHLLEALLAHEMAHVKRFDYLVNLGQNVVETLLFYHPAVWWISGRIRIEREHIADDFAARQLGAPRRLALALSELERIQFSAHHLAQGANGGDLMSRIKRLVRPDKQALSWKAAIPVLGMAAACMAIYAHAAPTQQSHAGKAAYTKAELDFRNCQKPAWPARALAAENAGTVTVRLGLNADGTVTSSKTVHSSGFADLDEASRAAFGKCRFKPATKAGKPVKGTLEVKYVWDLK